MKTTSAYQGFLMQHGEQMESLQQQILKHSVAKRIYLLGLTHQRKRTESLFSVHGVSASWISHYYVLLLVERSNNYTLCSVQDKIENNLQHITPVTAIVLYLDEFIQWLLNGHPFANAVCQKAQLIYEDNGILPIPKEVNEQEQKKEIETLYTQTASKLESFLAGAELYKIRKEYKLAAFMLHQAAEQSLRAMLIINTGLKINTHSIDKLFRYNSMFCYQLPELFPRNNEKEKRLYTLLNKAYIHARYKDDYSITHEELTTLTEKLKRIKQLFESYKPMSC